jgi:D-alanine-D-alanine ligase
MTKKLRVGVVFGGRSGEHEVSVRSARSVIEALDKNRYEVVPLAITKTGKWLSPADSANLLPGETKQRLQPAMLKGESRDIAIIGDPSHQGLTSLDGKSRPAQPLDLIFPVLHGTYGEDGTLQGLLEMAGVPYVGCGVLASACGMDKVTMKALFRDAGLPICRYTWFLRSQWEKDAESIVRRVSRQIGFPCFVKPANLGSSVGISKATDKKSLRTAIELAARYDRKVIIEEGLDAREIECAVMGNDDAEASLPGEYVVHDPAASFLDYTEKYSSTGHVDFVVPAPLTKAQTARIRRMAVEAFKVVDGSGLARVDFFLRRDNGELLLNELNTLPGLTDVSGYPKMWEATGLPFPKVIDRLVALALERHREKQLTVTSL